MLCIQMATLRATVAAKSIRTHENLVNLPIYLTTSIQYVCVVHRHVIHQSKRNFSEIQLSYYLLAAMIAIGCHSKIHVKMHVFKRINLTCKLL